MDAQDAKARLDSRTADPLPNDVGAETAGDLSDFDALIPLRTSDAGKPVQITYKGEFPQYASNIGALRIGTFGELMGTMLRESFWSVVFAFASLVLGAFMTVTGSIMAVRRRQTALFNIGAFAVCISLWVLSESAMRQMYLADLGGACSPFWFAWPIRPSARSACR